MILYCSLWLKCFQFFQMLARKSKEANLQKTCLDPFPCHVLLKLFPFGIILNPQMTIVGAGEKLMDVAHSKGNILGHTVTKHFRLRRPKGIQFTWKNVSCIGILHSIFLFNFLLDEGKIVDSYFSFPLKTLLFLREKLIKFKCPVLSYFSHGPRTRTREVSDVTRPSILLLLIF